MAICGQVPELQARCFLLNVQPSPGTGHKCPISTITQTSGPYFPPTSCISSVLAWGVQGGSRGAGVLRVTPRLSPGRAPCASTASGTKQRTWPPPSQ